MKKVLTIGLAGVALAATLSLVPADSLKRGQTTAADALPAAEILTTVRSMGLDPIGDPLRRGHYYVLHAYDPRGIEVRVVADAQLGDIVSVRAAGALNSVYAPRYQRGPRIIHIPQRDELANTGGRDLPAADSDDDEPVKPVARHRTASPLADGPTPIRPTPRFNARANEKAKAGAPDDAIVSPRDGDPAPIELPRGN